MSEQETASNRYHPAQRVMHWLMAVLILGMIAIGWYMHGLERESELRPILYGLHKSTGVLVLMLFSIRVILRVKKGAPALPAAIKAWEAKLAHAVHGLLYGLIFAVPMAGIWMSNTWGHGVSFYGLFEFKWFETNKDIAPTASETHEILAYLTLAVVGLHVLGALKHRFVDKHDVIYRMTWGKKPDDA